MRGPGVRQLGVMARLTRLDIPVNIAKRRRAMKKQSDDENQGKGGRRGKRYSRERERGDRERERARECRKNRQMLRLAEGKIVRDTKNEKRKGDEWAKKRERERKRNAPNT